MSLRYVSAFEHYTPLFGALYQQLVRAPGRASYWAGHIDRLFLLCLRAEL